MACTARKMLGRTRLFTTLQPHRVLRLIGVASRYRFAVPRIGCVCRTSQNKRHFTTVSGTEARLLSCVKEEISMERGQIEQLPEVTGFTSSTDGCVVTLQKQNGSNKVTVELDTHDAMEVLPEEQEEGDEGEPFFVPAFTVTIRNSIGSQLQVDCSFDEHGHYTEQGNEWDNLSVDSMCVIPANSKSANAVYTVTADNLSTDIYESLLGYLQEHGIDETFLSQVVHFYQVHEHRCYLEHSLKALRDFLQNN